MSGQLQRTKAYFDPTPDRRYPTLPDRPTEETINLRFAPNNKQCPLNRIITGSLNEGKLRMYRRWAKAAHRRWDRNCRGFNHLITARPGQGKTFIEKCWAESIGIPFVFVQSGGLKDTWDLHQQIAKECEKVKLTLVPDKRLDKKADFVYPPIIVLFDEVHETKMDLQKGPLLNPMEPDDGYMHIREPGQNGDRFVADCHNVCWVGATTDPQELFDAFRSRFLNEIQWASATGEELPAIIKAGLDAKVEKGELPFAAPLDVCRMITKYQTVPRLAIHSFGAQVILQKEEMKSYTWDEAVAQVASDFEYDKYGLTRRQVLILSALGQRPIAKARLGNICQCRTEEVESVELPGLQQYTNGGPFCTSVSGRGLCITEAGLAELDKRGIGHHGRKVTAEHFEAKR